MLLNEQTEKLQNGTIHKYYFGWGPKRLLGRRNPIIRSMDVTCRNNLFSCVLCILHAVQIYTVVCSILNTGQIYKVLYSMLHPELIYIAMYSMLLRE